MTKTDSARDIGVSCVCVGGGYFKRKIFAVGAFVCAQNAMEN